jgi:hypothetical protein
MLSPLDDYLAHQIPDTFDHVGTSDRNFYDRYYFNAHPCDGDVFLILGMGQYPNLGVTDAFITVSHGDRQYVVRSSRELGSDRLNTAVGPIRVEVIEGLRRLRCVVEPNEWGVACDLTWEGQVPATEEPRFFQRAFARVITDGCRLTQTGRWTGTLTVAGTTYEVTPDRWWGGRDHSWGIRAVGEPEPPGIRATLPRAGFFHNWINMQFPDFTVLVYIQEDADGRRTHEEAVRVFPYDSSLEMEHIGTPRHKLEFRSGTRELERATITFAHPSGKDIVVTATPLRTVYLSAGTGYGTDADWRHGMYQGPLKVQGLTYDIGDAAVRARVSGLNEALCRYDLDGAVGYGVYEMIVAGAYRPYGFNAPGDVAP